MATIVGVRFHNAGKLYYFDPGQLWPTAGDAVIVETARGLEYGEVVTGVHECPDEEIRKKIDRMHRLNLHKLQLMPNYKPGEGSQKAI